MDRKKQSRKKQGSTKNQPHKQNITSLEKKRKEQIRNNKNKTNYPKATTYSRINNNTTTRTSKVNTVNRNSKVTSINRNNKVTKNKTNKVSTINKNSKVTSINRDSGININNNRYGNNSNYRSNYYDRPIQNKKIYRAKKKPKNRNINFMSRLFTVFMFTIIISYFGISVSKSLNKKPVDYESIEIGSIEDSTQAKGIIIRDEIVYKSSKKGVLTFNKTENERVKKGELVATIKNQEEIKTAEKDIELINEKILQLQEQRDELSIFYQDVKKIDNQIQQTLDKYISELSTYNVSKIYELRDSISKKVTIRNQMLLSENTGSVQDLSSQKAAQEQKVNKNMENIYANNSGIVSYYKDGLEETFTFENREKLTKEQTLMQPKEEQEFKLNVVEGERVFKVVKDNNFYIGSYINTQSISTWEQGETRTIYIKDNGDLRPLEVIIEKINIGEKESYVLMKSNKNMIDFIDKRNITFELSKPKEGFKIKLDAIAEEELLKIPTSYIVESNVTKKSATGEPTTVPIKISGQDETGEYTYVSISKGIIDIGDYIINPQTKQEIQLSEIFTKKGIYIVNSGIYNFKNIDTEGSVQNDIFIILDPSKNTTIKLYDRYAPDLSVVKGEETVANEK